MKKLFCVLAAVMLLLVSCGPKIIAIMPVYKGEEVTDTHHEFANEDFYVLATYEDGTQAEVKDFKFKVLGMQEGYYYLQFTVGDFVEETLVPIYAKIYPSDKQG